MAAWVLRRQGLDRFPVVLARRRLYILPTRAGLGFGLMLLGMLIAGLNYGNSLALFLTFWLAGLALTAMHQCHRNLLALTLSDLSIDPAFAGAEGLLRLAITNDSLLARYRVTVTAEAGTQHAASGRNRRSVAHWLRGRRAAARRPPPGTAPAASPDALLDLAPQASGVLSLALRAERRGIHRLPRLRISSTHPFGLFRVWTWIHAPVSWVVYPSAQGTLPLPAPVATRDSGALRGGLDQQEWLGLRAFRTGDSPRQVAWKTYARGGPLLTKEYAASGAAVRVLDWAQLPALPLEQRLSQLARWVVEAEARGERYGLALPGIGLKPDSGPAQRHQLLQALAGFGLESEAQEAVRA